MSDLVERLRTTLTDKDNMPRMKSERWFPVGLAADAADEIERLRAEVEVSHSREMALRACLLKNTPELEAEIERLRAWEPAVRRECAKQVTELTDEIERLKAELEHEKAQTKIVLDSYADENQRFHDEIERLRAALKSCVLESRDWMEKAKAALNGTAEG